MIPFRRRHTLALLNALQASSLPLDTAMNFYFRANRSLGAKDRLAISSAIYTLVRWQGAIDAHLTQPITWEKRLEALDHLDLKKISSDTSLLPHIRCSFPKVLFNLLAKAYGHDEALRLCLILNERAPLTLRVNTLKTTREELKARLPLTLHDGAFPTSLIVEGRANLFTLPEFKEGFFECQDAGSQEMADLVDAKPGDHVLDYCSGSGGKTLAIAPKLEGRGQLYLYDIRARALQEAKKRLNRAGITNVQIFSHSSQKMDHILTDVPCSGTGTLRRNPDLKWKFSTEMLDALIQTQREIVQKVIPLLKPGGQLIYVTCSLLPEENENQVEFFLAHTPLKLLSTRKLLPTSGSHDGFFGAVFKLPT